jgi:hypothetical protein
MLPAAVRSSDSADSTFGSLSRKPAADSAAALAPSRESDAEYDDDDAATRDADEI